MKRWVRSSALGGFAFALSATASMAAAPVCSAEYERVTAGAYEWRGTILADDGKVYDFAIANLAEAGAIAAVANGERGATGAYEALLLVATQRVTVATPEAITELRTLIAAANDADVTIMGGAGGNGTWTILCFTPFDAADPFADPVLVERRGDRVGVNPASDELRAALIALDPAFAIEAAAAETPRKAN